jgi:hypothetical protein
MKERAKECARARNVPRQSQAEILVAREFIALVKEAAAEGDLTPQL